MKPRLSDDQALEAAARIGHTVMACVQGGLYADEAGGYMSAAASFIRNNPDAPAEAVNIHLQRKRRDVVAWDELPESHKAGIEFFKLALIMLDARLEGMQPAAPRKALAGYAEPAEILADQPGDLTDQAVR